MSEDTDPLIERLVISQQGIIEQMLETLNKELHNATR